MMIAPLGSTYKSVFHGFYIVSFHFTEYHLEHFPGCLAEMEIRSKGYVIYNYRMFD